MIRRRVTIAALLAASLIVAFGGFLLLSEPLRHLEERLVLDVLRSGNRVTLFGDHDFQVLPPHHAAFRAQLTPFCSSLVPVLALAAIAAFVVHGHWLRRSVAWGCAAGLVVACNVLRIAGSLWVGLELGPSGLVLFHDWVGTIFGLGYTMVGFFLMLYLLLPRATTRIPRAARVSDVL
ncbi:MAG: exosortase/archaeosortase family protein [Acidothermus sp.]|nr:exosortase/archaeosortase family protein [Acidothermus sp.]MCL6537215.1 exosortase/archaeosortase family protein [Acidothermus sp.]